MGLSNPQCRVPLTYRSIGRTVRAGKLGDTTPTVKNPPTSRTEPPGTADRTPQRNGSERVAKPRSAVPTTPMRVEPKPQAPSPVTRQNDGTRRVAPVVQRTPVSTTSDRNASVHNAPPRVESTRTDSTIRHGRRASSIATEGEKSKKKSGEKTRGPSGGVGTPRR